MKMVRVALQTIRIGVSFVQYLFLYFMKVFEKN